MNQNEYILSSHQRYGRHNNPFYDFLKQDGGIKYLNQMSTYHSTCGDSEIT